MEEIKDDRIFHQAACALSHSPNDSNGLDQNQEPSTPSVFPTEMQRAQAPGSSFTVFPTKGAESEIEQLGFKRALW